jgi:hypothetical protein
MYTYNKLEQITRVEKPYRGSTNRYPTGNRLHSTKNFFVEELDGEKVFKVTYGVSSERVFITKEQYEEMTDKNERSAFNGSNYETNKPEYWYYATKPYELGIMRPDETFEFTTNHLHQGTNMYLTNEFTNGYVSCSSRHGGVIYKNGWRHPSLMFPIFKGLRIRTDNLMPHESLDIQLYKKNIDRKIAKPMLAEYGDMIKTSGVMFSAMEMEMFANESKELITTTINGANTTSKDDLPYMTPDNMNKLVEEAKKSNREGRYFDCAVINAYLMDAGRFQYMLRWGNNSYYAREKTPLNVHQAMVRGLTKRLYKNEEPFTKTLIEWGKPYSSSDWGFDLIVNGEEKHIYG